MDLVIQAIETSELRTKENIELNISEINNKNIYDKNNYENNEPIIQFEKKPPQWCIVDKWFTMKVLCYDNNIKNLEVIVTNNENEKINYIQSEIKNKQDNDRIIEPLDQFHR